MSEDSLAGARREIDKDLSKISDDGRLLLCGLIPVSHPDLLLERGVTHVVSVVQQPLPHRSKKIHYLHLAADDRADFQLVELLPRAHDFLAAALAASPANVCVVHCAAGISRSASVVISFLVAQRGLDLPSAYRWVKQRRPQICPNAGFFAQLCDWAEQRTPGHPDRWTVLADYVLETRFNGGHAFGITTPILRQALIETKGDVTAAQLLALQLAQPQQNQSSQSVQLQSDQPLSDQPLSDQPQSDQQLQSDQPQSNQSLQSESDQSESSSQSSDESI